MAEKHAGWKDARPHLNDAIAALGKKQKEAVVLCFLEGRTQKDAASVLGCSEDAVKMRIQYALPKLRAFLSKKGVLLPAVALAAFLQQEAVLASGVASAQVVGLCCKAAMVNVAAQGAAASKTVLLAKGTMKMMFLAKVKAVAVVTTATVFAAGVAVPSAVALFGPDPQPPKARPDVVSTSEITPTKPLKGKPAPAVSAPNPALTKRLQEKIAVIYRRDTLEEVLKDLDWRAGLQSTHPRSIGNTFFFSMEEKNVTVKTVLEKLAAEGGLVIEYHGDTVVFWKPGDSGKLAALEKKYQTGDVQARCEAVHDLAVLADKRIYPTLFRALSDKSPAVVYWTLKGLLSHQATLRYGKELDAAFRALKKLRESPPSGVHEYQVRTVLYSTGHPGLLEMIKPLLKAPKRAGLSNTLFFCYLLRS